MERAGRGALFSAPVSYLPRSVLDARNLASALGTSWLLTFLPSFLLAILIAALLPDAPKPQFPFKGADLLFQVVIYAPILETLIMGALLIILQLFLRPTAAILVTAVTAGVAHSFAPTGVAIWGLVIWWPFLIFATLFIAWRQRSLIAAFAAPALAHALHNLPTALLLAADFQV